MIYPKTGVGRFCYIGSKGVGEVQSGAVFFNLKSLASSCCLQGRLRHTCFHICFRPDGIFKLLHVRCRTPFFFFFKYKPLIFSLVGFCRCRTQNTHVAIVLRELQTPAVSVVATAINFKQKNYEKKMIKSPLPTSNNLALLGE